METVKGVLERFVFQSPENGFSIGVLTLDNNKSIHVKGNFAYLHAGQEVEFQGSWTVHPKFGRQFDVTACISITPTTIIGLRKYLGSGRIKGIGPAYAEKLVNYFGLDVLKIIEHTPERLQEVEGIGQKRIVGIVESFKADKNVQAVMMFLQEKDISPAYAAKIYKVYGDKAAIILEQNPYKLAEDISGIGFKVADAIAQKMGFDKFSVKRIEAGIRFCILQATQQGHLYCELENLKTTTLTLLELTIEHAHRIKLAFHNLYEQAKIKIISHGEQHYITLSQFYFSEKFVAERIKLLQEHQQAQTFNIDDIYTQLHNPKAGDLVLHEQQQRGVMACLQNKITVITGGPGTGKTTLIKKLLSVLEEHGCRYKLAAPTGRAAKRIIEGTGRHAMTIHRLLDFDVATMQFLHNESNALPIDYLIIDEASMIDVFLAQALLRALPYTASVVFIGDVDQLPSVGAGNILNDLIKAGTVACVRLTQIFRQASDSLIIVNAHRVNNGEFPISSLPEAKKDFKFIKEDDPEKIQDHIRHLYTKELARHSIATKDAIVLVPMNRGAVGTQRINQFLQQLLCTAQEDERYVHNGTLFNVGDRVMQIRNNYDKAVFNGDIGTILTIDREDKTITVQFDFQHIVYEAQELDELILAYAVSIHKSQGSEYAAVIIVVFMQHFTLLQRNLIYTAITRAGKLCIIIGQPKALGMAINNTKGVQRITFLQHYLTSDLVAR